MSELLGPTYLFDVRLGTIVESIDVDPDAILVELRDRRLSDEAISDTVIEFTSEAWDLTERREGINEEEVRVTNAITEPRRILVYIGSYAIGRRVLSDSGAADAATLLKLSKDMAHEIEHLGGSKMAHYPWNK